MLSGLLKRDVFAAIAAIMTMFAAGAAGAVDTLAKQAIIVDYQTGTVLMEKNADESIHPASMSKLMTLEILFQQLKKGQIKLTDTFPVSERAWAHNEGSTMFVGINTQIPVEDLIRGIVVQSGNDACIVVAEGLSGTEEAFVELMNKRAAELGLENSHFRNSHGLEDPNHKMTVRDLLKLAEHIYREYPEYYHYFSEKEFVFNNIKQQNRNPLIYKNIGVDGLKTGHLSVSGFGVVVSAQRDGRRIFMVLHGMEDMQQRSDEATNMVEWAFREFNNYALAKPGQVLDEAPVWYGSAPTVPLTVATDLVATLPRSGRDQAQIKVIFDGPIPAPIAQGQEVGKIVIETPGYGKTEAPLVAAAAVDRQGFVGRAFSNLEYFLFGM
ncbi:MAG TPA: D-alanyl-D-alanine carboxypeptidase family protein [Verrucomicrobiae bacterium]|nr:D-alanyl-D-alanine carboxypeptidase family protein [Verrucomicrobiae bacterium]